MREDDYLRGLFSLRGRAAVVSGGGSGIGRRLAAALAAAGAKVALLGRREELLRDAAAEINAKAGEVRAAPVRADLADLESLPETAKRVTAAVGAPTIVVNAAGVNLRSSPYPEESARDITLESWRKTLDINLAAPFFLSREFVAGMKDGGTIINIGSLQSLRAGLGDAAYGASKGGLAQLTRAMAKAWGSAGVTANALLPGYFPSDMTKLVFDNAEMSERLAKETLLGRNGALADLEGAVIFFASPASAYITGALLPIDGGCLAK